MLPWTIVARTGGRSIRPVNRVHPNSVHRVRRYGVYRAGHLIRTLIGAFKGVNRKTYDHAGQRCH